MWFAVPSCRWIVQSSASEMPSSTRRYSIWTMTQSSKKAKNCREGMVVAVEFARGQTYVERRVLDLMMTRKLLMDSRKEGTM
jgi:hypothetical protein